MKELKFLHAIASVFWIGGTASWTHHAMMTQPCWISALYLVFACVHMAMFSWSATNFVSSCKDKHSWMK